MRFDPQKVFDFYVKKSNCFPESEPFRSSKVFYHKLVSPRNPKNFWLVNPYILDAVEHIYYYDDENQNGFYGREMSFDLVTGERISVKGPWKSNALDLFDDLNIDLRDRYLTFVCVAKTVYWSSQTLRRSLYDILYQDPQGGMIGKYDRDKEIAQSLANKLQHPVFYCMITPNGSIADGPVYPSNLNIKDWHMVLNSKGVVDYWYGNNEINIQ